VNHLLSNHDATTALRLVALERAPQRPQLRKVPGEGNA
jgi:hypothetical protein